MAVVADQLLGAFPGGAGGGDVALAVLGFPGEAFAHDVQRHQFGEFRQHASLAGLPRRDLTNCTTPTGIAMADVPEHHAERGRRLALALAGVDDQQALLAGLGRHDLVARRLVLARLLRVPFVLGFV